jgi:hypothetical protein
MAKVWPVYEGKTPTSGEQWADIPLNNAIELFHLGPKHFVSDLVVTPRFGHVERDLTWAGYKHVVVEIETAESANTKWRPGFYKSTVKPKEAFRRLIQYTLTTVLGEDNIVRVDYDQTVDSLGHDAIRAVVVVTPGAPQRIANESVLNASVALQSQLRKMRAMRPHSPLVMIEYATEAELAQDAGT